MNSDLDVSFASILLDFFSFRRPVRRIANAVLTAGCFATLCSVLAQWHWIAELATHFRAQYVLVGLVVLGYCLVSRIWWRSALCAGLVVWHVLSLVPFYMPSPNASDEAANLRIVMANVFGKNENTDAFLSFVRETDPDIVCVQEVRPHWAKALEQLHEAYPHRTVIPRTDFFGIATYSKFPFEEIDLPGHSVLDVPVLTSRIDVAGRPIMLVNIHTTPPMNYNGSRHRVFMLQRVQRFLDEREEPIVVAGDLNTTPWSPVYIDFAEGLKLTNTRQGFGIFPSWPASRRPGMMMIPIDHILVGPEIGVIGCERGPDVGSDHYPILADLQIPADR